MSTKSTIAAGYGYHLFEEVSFDDATEAFLTLCGSLDIVYEKNSKNREDRLTVAISPEVMDGIAVAWVAKRKLSVTAAQGIADEPLPPDQPSGSIGATGREIMNPAGEGDMKHVHSIQGGYLVRKTVAGRVKQGYFSAAKHGGMENALVAAQEARDNWVQMNEAFLASWKGNPKRFRER